MDRRKSKAGAPAAGAKKTSTPARAKPPAAESDRFKRGVTMVSHLMGEETARQMVERVNSGGYGASRSRFMLDTCFGEVWSSPDLDLRSRSLIVIAMLIAKGGLADELKGHLHVGLRNGLTPTELEAIILHATLYVGIPGTNFAAAALKQVLEETGNGST